MKILKNTQDFLQFEINGYPISFVNALRRVMMSEVEIPAIDGIEIEENTGLMKKEELLLRLGLIPLPHTCDEGVLTLDVEAGDQSVEVLSTELKNDRGESPTPDILITKLAPHQRLKLEARIKRGRGKTNAKYSPVTQCCYRFVPNITLKQRVVGDRAVEIYNLLPTVFGIKGKELFVNNERNYFFDIDVPKELVDITYDPTHVIFSIETVGTITPYEVVMRAFDILDVQLDNFASQIRNNVPRL